MYFIPECDSERNLVKWFNICKIYGKKKKLYIFMDHGCGSTLCLKKWGTHIIPHNTPANVDQFGNFNNSFTVAFTDELQKKVE